MIGRKSGISVGYILFALCIACLTTPTLEAQDASRERDEIKAVFRISKQFLNEMTDRQIVADIPLCATVLGFRCTGVIHAEGKVSIELPSNGTQAIFSVDSRGDGHACVRGVRGPIVATGTAWGPFTSHTLVQFDGRQFTHLSTTPCVNVHGKLQRVTGRRDRPIGRVIGSGMRPLASHLIPQAEVQATPIAKRYLQSHVEEMADQIIARLNKKTPVQESVNRLFSEPNRWIFQMSSDAMYIQAAYGPVEAVVPVLPDAPTRMDDVHLEAWLRSTSEEAELLESLSKRPLAKQLVERYLESTLPELAALGEERSVDAVDQWVVIRVGARQEK
jgi:hypothetical protein